MSGVSTTTYLERDDLRSIWDTLTHGLNVRSLVSRLPPSAARDRNLDQLDDLVGGHRYEVGRREVLADAARPFGGWG